MQLKADLDRLLAAQRVAHLEGYGVRLTKYPCKRRGIP